MDFEIVKTFTHSKIKITKKITKKDKSVISNYKVILMCCQYSDTERIYGGLSNGLIIYWRKKKNEQKVNACPASARMLQQRRRGAHFIKAA
jgi:hypothetical protein